MIRNEPGFPPLLDIMLHRGGMLLLDRILASDGDSLRAHLTVPARAWYSDEAGNMPAWIGIELMAQGIAACVGLQAWRRGERAKIGLLLGTRRYRASVPAFTAGDELEISVRLVYREENGLGAFDCVIVREREVVASATLKVFEPPDVKQFLRERA